MSGHVETTFLGRLPYRHALALQRERWQQIVDGKAPEVVYTLEHEPVVTLGRRGSLDHLRVGRDELALKGVDLVETDRGGELTYHGPGQLVVYPLLNVGERRIAVGDLVRALAGAGADALRTWGIEASYDPAHPGLWTDGEKVGAVGMRVSRGVSMHGMAINVTTDLEAFGLIVPCGMPAARTVSVSSLVAEEPDVRAFGDAVVEHLARRLGLDILRMASAP
jgi:lipoate-protein ligase B